MRRHRRIAQSAIDAFVHITVLEMKLYRNSNMQVGSPSLLFHYISLYLTVRDIPVLASKNISFRKPHMFSSPLLKISCDSHIPCIYQSFSTRAIS
jgi:hypothetical protein